MSTKKTFEDRVEAVVRANPGLTTYDIAVELRTADSRVKGFLMTKRGRKLVSAGLVATHDYPLMEQPQWFLSLTEKVRAVVPRKKTFSHSALPAEIPSNLNPAALEGLKLKAALVEKITHRGAGARRQRIRRDAGSKLNRIHVMDAVREYGTLSPSNRRRAASVEAQVAFQ